MQRLSDRFRARRDVLLRRVIALAPRQGETLRILDLGGRGVYWRRVGLDFLREQKVTVDILNLTTSEHQAAEEGGDVFSYVVGNACALDYADGSYDLCHANSVIEHVGLWRDMELFAGEVRRVAPAYFVQSPNFWFPVDPHYWRLPFQHWLPRPIRARLMEWLPLAHPGRRAADLAEAFTLVDSSRMLCRRQMAWLFPDAELHAERVLFLPKSFTAVRQSAKTAG